MEHSWYCLLLATVVVGLSTTPRPCRAKYRVYICRTELQSYYEDTEHADTVRGGLKCIHASLNYTYVGLPIICT